MSIAAEITVRIFSDYAKGTTTRLKVKLLHDKAKELTAEMDKAYIGSKAAVRQLGCSNVAANISKLFLGGMELSEDRALGFHRKPDYPMDLVDGSQGRGHRGWCA